ncbi:Pentatricopeptide repeat-containing protein At5g67570, chloroplastic [Linum perenne]
MEISMALPSSSAPSSHLFPGKFQPNVEIIKRRLLNKGVEPTPKIIHTLRKKEIQKHNRRLNKINRTQQLQPLTESEKQILSEVSHFQTVEREYKAFTEAVESKGRNEEENRVRLVGRPWESMDRVRLKEVASGSKEFDGGKLKRENLMELKETFQGNLTWLLNDDVDFEDDETERSVKESNWEPSIRKRSEGEAIRFLVHKLCCKEVTLKDWKLARMMKQSGLEFTEGQLLKIVETLGAKRKWKQALSAVGWVYTDKDRSDFKSRFVYTKLMSVLGKARRPQEALHIFNLMREDSSTYPDMAAYHSIAVTLGQAGFLKELIKVIECMREKPPKNLRDTRKKDWDPTLEPDLVIYNAVLNSCIPSEHWKGVSWVFEQLRKGGLKPNGATYGLAMEVMVHSGKYDLVHQFFSKMNKSGEAPKALTYKVLVKALREEGKVNEAVEAVNDMERRGVVGVASVYYELACCLCYHGRWRDAMQQIDKIKRIPQSKPLEYTFTGMILAARDGDHILDCICIFEHMKSQCVPNIGTINTMLRVYGQNDFFSAAKSLYEEIKQTGSTHYSSVTPDGYTYSAMLEASTNALDWEYFEHVYREMVFSGYQLDQTKHGLLLVKASKAGKGHLLEHAFNAILEAGEIPCSLYLVELVCLATVQQDYEKAVSLANTAAYAPFQINESLWKDFFKSYENKISKNSLHKLLVALGDGDVQSEATVSNLAKSLQSLCGDQTPEDSGSSISKFSYGIAGDRKVSMSSSSANGSLEVHIRTGLPASSADFYEDGKDGELELEIPIGSNHNPDLKFFSLTGVSVLQHPKEVLDLGYKELKKSLVGQLLGNPLPWRVLQVQADSGDTTGVGVKLEPVVVEPIETPDCVVFQNVPPPLCNHLGVGHFGSLVGRTLSKFTRVVLRLRSRSRA